ncbi:MAG: hypothetical protein IKN04_07665 [Clostridia bacterium]|nr:hypothetical protein [Clostridia bacterium]
MTRERFEALIQVTGPIAPEGIEDHISDLSCSETELLPKEALQFTLDWNHVPLDQQAQLMSALDAANAVPELVELSHIMAMDAVRALNRCTAIDFQPPKPACLSGFDRDAFAFLYSQLCVIEGRKALRLRGVPEAYDMDIPERMTRKQLRKFVETGDITFDDYPWDMNFYCCDIFLMDRFYFIPYRWDGAPHAWRNRKTGKVLALWEGETKVRRDGQLDGVNGVHDPDAFETVFEETEETVSGNPVSPDGYILPQPVSLDKREWTQAIRDGDYLLALHIPGGMGYTPERVKRSCEMALAFYERYFPEYRYTGFWSESWLYDPGLEKILSPDRNIIRVQRQFYRYPTMEGDEMTRVEVLGGAKVDYKALKPRNSLEKGLFAAWDRGERFHDTGMFLLKEEVDKIGTDPYRKEA